MVLSLLRMPWLLYIVIVSPFLTYSQKNENVSKISTQLVKDFNEFHLKPREINDEFGKSVHNLLLNSIDGDKILFNKANIAELESLALKIDDDIQTSQTLYLTRFKQLLKEAIDFGSVQLTAYFSQKTNLLTIPELSPTLLENYADASNHKQKWSFELRDRVLNSIVEDLADEGYLYPKDSLNSLIKRAEKSIQATYSDYFKNLHVDEELNELYLNAIAESFDPHSSFFSAGKMKRFEAELTSEREIFGFNFYKNRSGEFEITNVYPGSSAWLSGDIHEGDIVVSLKFGNEKKQNLDGLTMMQLNNLFAENKSSLLELTLLNNKHDEVSVVLEKRKIYSDEDIVKTAILSGDKKIGYISLPDFYLNETDTTNLGCANDIAKAIIKLKAENIEGLILDLRNNGGGSLREAIDLSGIFIDYGPILVNCDEEANVYSLKDMNKGTIYRGPLVVMINQYAASASEIVAASLQDYNRAIIVGQTSYGKATGQFVLPLDPNRKDEEWGYAKITNLGLYRVDLSTNQKRGVIPDIQLIDVNQEEIETEKSYANAIHLDSISKKIYFTPLPKLDLTDVRNKSEERQKQNLSIQQEEEFYAAIEDLISKALAGGLGLDTRLEKFKQIEDRWKVWDDNTSPVERSFEITFLQNENDIYSLSPYLSKYREHFKDNLVSDYELSETYSILSDFIK
jgi:carboxyl-terminal processing protease